MTQKNPQDISLGKKRADFLNFSSQLEADGTGVDDLLQVLDVVSRFFFLVGGRPSERGDYFVVVSEMFVHFFQQPHVKLGVGGLQDAS